ncbi:class I SAM-dependent RNA methyltransferase [Jonesia quinghaiensis]|uniref:class I SAM-dependent RNA methyltransferase n=1 Tax=Jonesia quinghaiensis TaxID=262806 RepID=UPI0003FC577D|nr:TRAM domain-containing protein [Jonesia quinghaiensis]
MSQNASVVGQTIEVTVDRAAHGGECVGRSDGRVVFVRDVIPGERVLVRLTEGDQESRFWRGELVEVLDASEHRVVNSWAQARRHHVGGADLAHVSLTYQREWKRQVVADQLQRLGGYTWDGIVEAAPREQQAQENESPQAGWGWRTRFEVVADARGRAGMYRHRSHDLVPLNDMPLATDEARELAREQGIFTRTWPTDMRLEVVAPSAGAGVVTGDGEPLRKGHIDVRPNARRNVTEQVSVGETTYRYRVAANGFWQVHVDAPSVLVNAVLDALGDVTGRSILDAYCGSGLFTVPLADRVGASGSVVGIEGNTHALRDARRNVLGASQDDAGEHVRLIEGDVASVLRQGIGGSVDVVVLDPPRVGAGKKVVDALAALEPATIVYVACDPAALGRDIAFFAEAGYTVSSVRAFDLFPMTHHVECLAVLTRG